MIGNVMAQVEALVKTHIEREDAGDWAFVRRVPSTHTWKIVDGLRALDPTRRSNLCQAFAGNALYLFDPARDPALHATRSDPGFNVTIDYGGWDQLRYEVEYEDARTGLHLRRLSYERLVGAGLGHWDSLTAGNLEESVTLLCELVDRLVELPDQLPDH